MYQISPFPVITTKTITSFKIDRIEISLFKSAIITIILLDSAGSILDVKFINLIGDDYSKWDADDSYIINFIKQSLGFSDVTDISVADTSVTDTSVADTSVADTSVADTSVADTSVTDTSVADTSVADTSVTDTSVTDTSVADTSVTDTSVADTSVADTSVADTSPVASNI